MALPTPPDGDGVADLSYILKAAKDISKLIKLTGTDQKIVYKELPQDDPKQ